MKADREFAPIAESRLSKQLKEEDDAAANEEEVEEKIEEDNVEKNARENGTGAGLPMIRSNKQMESDDDAVASREKVEEQVEQNRVDKEAFEDGISTASAGKYIPAETHYTRMINETLERPRKTSLRPLSSDKTQTV